MMAAACALEYQSGRECPSGEKCESKCSVGRGREGSAGNLFVRHERMAKDPEWLKRIFLFVVAAAYALRCPVKRECLLVRKCQERCTFCRGRGWCEENHFVDDVGGAK